MSEITQNNLGNEHEAITTQQTQAELDHCEYEATRDPEEREQQLAYWRLQELEALEAQAKINAQTETHSGAEAVLFDQIQKWLYMSIEDRAVVEFVLAVHKSHEMGHADSPLWGIVVGPSGGGKSELLRTLLERPDVFHLSKANPNAFISGWRGKTKNGKQVGEDPSLLLKMDGKIVVIPDFAPILSQRADARNEILSTFREAYDGKISDGKGNLGNVVYRSRFTLLTASTAKIDELGGEISELGERFIRIRLRGKDGIDKARRAARNLPHLAQMRAELTEAINTFLSSLGKMDEVTISDEMCDKVADIASLTAQARSPVYRDRFTREVSNLPIPEEGGRLSIQLIKLIRAVCLVRGRKEVNDNDIQFIQRVAEDCIPPVRLQIIQKLQPNPQHRLSGNELAEQLNTAPTSARRTLEDLQLLGLLSVEYGANHAKKYSWKIQ
jgi:hypothetical protein